MIIDQEHWNHCANCGVDLDILRQSGAKNASRIKIFCSRSCRYECKTYKHWFDMVSRCHDPSARNYVDYGARGIQVCERWRNSYRHFLADLGPKPGVGYTLDRFPDRRGDYEPGNVRWATVEEQNQNRTSTRLTPSIVREIRARHERGESYKQIAFALSLKYLHVYRVANGTRWRNV